MLILVFLQEQSSSVKYEAVELLRREERYFNFYFIGLYLIVHFFCPFLLLTVLNTKIVITVKKSNIEVRISNRQYREYRIAIMMVVIVLVFVICNITPFILNIVEGFKRELFIDEATHFVAYIVLDVSNLLVVINSSVSVLIYYGFSQRYRDLFKVIMAMIQETSLEFGVLRDAIT